MLLVLAALQSLPIRPHPQHPDPAATNHTSTTTQLPPGYHRCSACLLLSLRLAVAALQHEVDNLTRLLVDVKVAFAEKDSEVMRLAQRLKRSLLAEHSTRDEVENLRRRLAALTPDQAVLDAEFGISKQLAAEGLDDSLLHTSQAHSTANGGSHAAAAAAAAPAAPIGPPSLQRGGSLRLLGASTTSNRITSDHMAPATGQGVLPTLT
ncbi:hypothetical protein QJQ45_004993 [Haematococcus lacustris]|nr:hypothetical protein QJQ45_004993 [Haematococcus lacustris]